MLYGHNLHSNKGWKKRYLPPLSSTDIEYLGRKARAAPFSAAAKRNINVRAGGRGRFESSHQPQPHYVVLRDFGFCAREELQFAATTPKEDFSIVSTVKQLTVVC